MTLRRRLTTAFLAVVLGPVLLGAFFVSGTVTALDQHRSAERLRLAASTVRTSVNALCQQLRAAAEVIAVRAEPADRGDIATQVVARGLAAAVLITDARAGAVYRSATEPPPPWADCARPDPAAAPARALSVRLELRDPRGTPAGEVTTTLLIDATLLARLAAASGAEVTLLGGDALAPGETVRSTEPPGVREAVLAAAGRTSGDGIVESENGRYVRRVGPVPGQPLPLALSVPREQPRQLYAALVAAVVVAGLLAVLAAWRLAGATTRPLAELASAVDRVADGDLAARIPVGGQDEVGRLASTFNRMTRETRSYVQALTSSRDQLRGHLAVLGDTLASTHDLQRILRVILQTALVATGARAGVVLLLDQSGGVLVGRCAEGLAGRRPVPPDAAAAQDLPLRVPLGSGLLGTVAATGEPQRGRVRPGSSPLCPQEPICETYVAVPFAAPGAAGESGAPPGAAPDGKAVPPPPTVPLGVLALYDRLGSDEFDDADVVTLRTFAAHAAVAVNNVRMHEEAQRLSLTDPLTGLWNYRYLKESIRREVERASRFGRMLSVLALDLDRFKDVNDTYGHAAGDAVLAEFARRVRGALREVDLAFRQGGEEFVVLLPETDARGAATVAERLGAAVRDAPIMIDPHPGGATAAAPAPVRVTVSIGIAVYPDHAATGQRVLDAADDALYAAKAAGRDTYRLAVVDARPVVREIPVPAGGSSPEDGLPRAGGVSDGPPGGASSGPQPPRQSRGR
ncbi:diguanylate cyclase [Micromonospora sp. NPDC049559]|uniref:diguanylate cyclase n=1 Tax=Micromonospora sp. NPDC049559 TaxID=3155923 RepID=UPI0034199207